MFQAPLMSEDPEDGQAGEASCVAVTEQGRTDGLTRLTVNLVPQAWASLLEAAKVTGDTRTDTVNRALSLYSFIVGRQAEGWEPAMVGKDGVIKTFSLG